jgi:prolipoprotein diacylglyceryltransferase
MVALPAELISVSQEGTAYLVAPAAGGSEASDGVAAQAREFGLTREQLVREATQHRSTRLHPAQLYASIGAALLAVVLSTAFYRRKHHGAVFALLLILYPIMRFFEEIIRMDNPHDTAGLTVSQFTSVPILALGVGLLLVIRRLPQRSPKAVPYVPPRKQEAAPKRQPKSKGRRAAR